LVQVVSFSLGLGPSGQCGVGLQKYRWHFLQTAVMTVQKRQTQRQAKKNTRVEGEQRFRLDRRDLLNAMESLYMDQLKPASRTLRRRIGEWASGLTIEEQYGAMDGGFQHLPNIDLAHVKSVCRGCSCIQVQMEEGGDWSAVFNDRPQVFVDIYNPRDPFSDAFWENFSKYLEGLSVSNMFFPGTRYACAQALVSRQLEFLFSYTLGQVCHMVEIAISRRKLLGYCNGAIVPYSHSLSMQKEQCAEQQRRCSPVGSCTTDVGAGCQAYPMLQPATLEVARRYLREILQATTMVPLSNIKRIFRTQYQTELSETLLGHSRLSDLLHDPRFHDLCTVQLQRNGYAVIAQPGLQEAPMLATGQGFSCTAEEAPRFEVAALMPTPVPSPVAALPTPLPSPGVPQSAWVQNWSTWHGHFQTEGATSYHQQLQPGLEESLWGNSISRAPRSQPQYSRVECYGQSLEPAGGESAVDAGPVTISLSLATPLPSPGVPTSTMQRGWSDKPCCTQFCKDEPLCLVPTPLASPIFHEKAVTRRWAESSQQSSLTRSGSSVSTVSGDTSSMASLSWEPSVISIEQGLLAGPTDDISRNASEDNLQLVDGSTQLLQATGFSASFAESSDQSDKQKGPRTPRWPLPTADVTNRQTTAETCFAEKVPGPTSALRKDMVVVHNTFIHAKMPPPTPIGHKHCSFSVLRDAYSSMGDASTAISDVRASEQQCNSGRWSPMTYRSSVGDAAITPCQDYVGFGLRPRFSPQLGSESRTLGLEVDLFPKKEMVSPNSLCAQGGRVGLTIQNTFVHTAPVLLAPSSNREKRSSSAPPKVCRTATSGCSIEDQALPLDLVSSVSSTPPSSGCESIAQAEEKEAMTVADHRTTAHAIRDDAAKAHADALEPQPQRRIVRSAKLLELMPPCCRTLFHSATALKSTPRAA